MSTMNTPNVVFLILSVLGPCSSASARQTDHGSAEVEKSLRTPEPPMPPVMARATTSSAGPAKTTYVCPMHPDVVMDAPGLCPKCNMKLEPKVNAARLR